MGGDSAFEGTHLSLNGVRRGFGRLLPMGAFTVPFGVAFGAAAVDAGVSAPQAIVMSAFVFSGAAQFAALDFWPTPIAMGSLAMVALALNARHVIMGAALSPWINRLPLWRRVLALAVLSDANFADSQPALKRGEQDLGVLLGGGLALWSAWVVGTTLGVGGGAVLASPEQFGIDVVMACFFVAVVTAQITRDRVKIPPVVVASAVAILTLGHLPTGWNVIVGAVCGAFAGLIRRDA